MGWQRIKIKNNRDNNRSQNFIYDNLNRIQQANSTGPNWGETFTIDAWGNLTSRGPVAGKTNYEALNAPATVKNQLTGFGYDAAGNMISNGTATYSYDGENRLATAGGYTYTYDGDGRRVKRQSGLLGIVSWPDLSGRTLDESGLTGTMVREYVFFNGQRVARRDAANNAVHYFFSDHLGSTSLVTNATGTMAACAGTGYVSGEQETDYYPYGGEYPPFCSTISDQKFKFTGKERDAESGLDNFGARYYGSALGRFTSPDKPFADQHAQAPQSWNLYSYTRNNPLKYIDTDGQRVQAADQAALNNIRQTLPANVRPHVVTDKHGFISGKALNGVKSNDANFQTLKHMVSAKATVEVSTGPTATNAAGKMAEFKYESDAAVRKDLQNMGITPTPGKDYTTNFTGITYGANESKSGNIEVHVSDGTGQAATAPGVELTVTTGHELYVHGANLLDGKPADHENTPNGPVNQQTREVEERTRKNAEEPK